MRLFFLGCFLLTLWSSLLSAQIIPPTSVYTFKMVKNGNSFRFMEPRYLTGFNPDGYNNQPHFINDDILYLTVQFPDDAQTDIYALDLQQNAITRVTRTVEGEYSPTRMPSSSNFSAVRVEADGQNTQRLWQFPLDRSNQGQPIFADIKGVGYHHWLSPQKVVLFLVDDPSRMMIVNKNTGAAVELLNNIGRGFQKMGNEKLAFIHKVTDDTWFIKEMNSQTYRFREIIQTLPKSEDFLYLRDGTILMGQGSKLYKYNETFDKDWRQIADFKYYGIKNITRLALSDNGTIAIVSKDAP